MTSEEDDERFPELCEQISRDYERYPYLDQAVWGLKEDSLRPLLVRLVDGGFTLDQIEAVLARLVPRYSGSGSLSRRLTAFAIIQTLLDTAHLGPPAEIDAWLEVHSLNLLREDTRAGTIAEIDAWLSCMPGPLARACLAAGLSLEEARDLQAAGRLNPQTIDVLAALRGLRTG